MIDFLKSQLLLVVVGVGAVSGGTGWVAKGQVQGREVFLLEAELRDCKSKVAEDAEKVSKDMQRRGDKWFKAFDDEYGGSIMVSPEEGGL